MAPRPPCGNPLWLSWLEELRDAAREKGIKSAEAYSKACRSLSACPVTYHRPRDLTVLQGIGAKTAQMLEVKWAGYCKDNGLPLPGEISPTKSKGKGKEKPRQSTDSEDEEDPDKAPKEKKRKSAAKKPPKQYIPAKGSGGYGIIMALILAIDHPQRTTTVYLTKSEIIRSAKGYSDSSYEHSEKGTYFTAWNGMKTLVNKGLVYVTGNPHKYCLTEEGYEVGLAVRKLLPDFAHLEQHPFVHDEDDVSVQRRPEGSPEEQQSRRSPPTVNVAVPPKMVERDRPAGPSRPNKFHFWYIDSSGRRVQTMGSAMVRLDYDDFINLRKIEFLDSQRTHPFASQLRMVDATSNSDISQSGPASRFAYLVEEGAPPMCSRFPDDSSVDPVTNGKPESPKSKKRSRAIVEPPSDDFDGIEPSDTPVKPSGTSTFTRTCSAPDGYANPAKMAADAALRRINKDNLSRTQSSSALPSKTGPRSGPRLSSHIPVATPLLEIDENIASTTPIPDFDPDQAIVFPAGSYDVRLVLDTREVESKSSRDDFSDKLRAKGIEVETRALRLGDVMWIAKRRDGLGGEEDECVLDYVVERKRLDDLCHSIKDGRYTEQCFRLSSSCINHVYYIVEDWDVTNRMQYDGKQIMTAKSQIQVHNRFFLKETTKISQTIDFLVTMTNAIKSSLTRTDLRIIPSRYLSRSTYQALQVHLRRTSPAHTYLTSFEAYQELNDKNASRTLKVAFGRMLLSVKGMSAERVSAILDIWETPLEMWEAVKARKAVAAVESEKGGVSGQKVKKAKVRGPELFFADTIQGEGRRKIGDALSKELYRALTGGQD